MKISYVNLSETNSVVLKKYYKILNEICRNSEFADPEGNTIKEFEKNFKKYTRSKYAVSVNSGSSALYLALKSLNLKKNDEVLTVAHSYVATVNSILLNGLKPIFCDIKNDLTIDENDLKKKNFKKNKGYYPCSYSRHAS